jgi:formylglycine-generating enzyme required for sulfatase activity
MMKNKLSHEETSKLKAAIKAQEDLRGILPDEQVDANIASLQEKLAGKGSMKLEPRSVAVSGNLQRSVVMTGDIYTGEPPKNEKEALAIYCRVLMSSVETLPMRGIDIGASDPESGRKRLSIANVFVDLDTKSQILVDADGKRISREDQTELLGHNRVVALTIDVKTQPISVIEAMAEEPQMVLLGDPGSGKSACVNYLTYCLAANQIEPEGGWLRKIKGWSVEEGDTIPVRIILRDFARFFADKVPKRAAPHHLWEFIKSEFNRYNLEIVAPFIEDLLNEGKVIVLLDGLDEVSTEGQRLFVRDAIQAFQIRYPNSRFLVTCRVLSYQPPTTRTARDYRLKNWEAHEIAPFDDAKISQFISAWHSELIASKTISLEEKKSLEPRLGEAVRREGLRDLASNPLLLTVMAMVHTHKGRLPDARALLYEEVIDILLWRWEQIKIEGAEETIGIRKLLNRAGKSDVDLKRTLWRLAYNAHSQTALGNGDQDLADIDEHELLSALRDLHGESYDWAKDLVDLMKLRAGILIERLPGVFTFPHRTFQEYMAGAYLAAQTDFAGRACKLVEKGDLWLEAILLAVGKLVYQSGDIDRSLDLAWELCPEEVDHSDLGWRKVWFAGRVVEEVNPTRIDNVRGQELVERVRNRLTTLLAEEALAPVERATAGNTLSRIGDPRFDPDALYLPKDGNLGFVKIPAGIFLMGSDFDKDELAFDAEVPQHRLELSLFYMAKWLVTVAQYQAFAGLNRHEMRRFADQNSLSNHPVVRVTWHEAIAYCRWLTEKLRMWKNSSFPVVDLVKKKGWVVTLPSEAEWEKAARAIDGRIYPWGNDFDKNRCNMDETGINTTSPVGCFPSGASPYMVEDQSGNVSEWTRSKWIEKGYPYPMKGRALADRENVKDKNVRRVLRGGSFLGDAKFVRCAFRGADYSDRWNSGSGFRVVVCPGPSGGE